MHKRKQVNFKFTNTHNINFRSGFVVTDDADRTNVDNIYCIGDLAHGKPELTPVAIQAGRLLARRMFAGGLKKVCFVFVFNLISLYSNVFDCKYYESP